MSEDAFTTSEPAEPIPPVYEYTIDNSSGDRSNGKSHDIIYIKQDDSVHSPDTITSEHYGRQISELDVSHQQAPYDAEKSDSHLKMSNDSSITDKPPAIKVNFSKSGSPQYQSIRNHNARNSCSETSKDGRKKKSRRHSEDSPSPARNDTRKRHSSGGAALSDRRYIEFGPVWLNGNGSVTDLTPGFLRAGAYSVKPVLFASHRDLTKSTGETTTAIGKLPVPRNSDKAKLAGARSGSREIAPIANLDESIRERRNGAHKRSHSSPAQQPNASVPDSSTRRLYSTTSSTGNSTSTTSPDASEDDKHSNHEEKLHSPVLDIIKGTVVSSIFNLSKSTSVADMKSALKRVRSKRVSSDSRPTRSPLKPARQSPERTLPSAYKDIRNRSDSTYSLQPMDESRQRSGSMARLRRARSFFVKSKSADDAKAQSADFPARSRKMESGPFQKQKSLNENHLYRSRDTLLSDGERRQLGEDSLHGITDADMSSISTPSASSNVMMQGDLYRRRRLALNKTWAVLTNDRLLTLYKSRKDFEESRQAEWAQYSKKIKRRQSFSAQSSLGGILSVINLAGGCEIENVEQGKKGTAFQLMPHSYHTFTFAGDSSTLPLDAEWRRTHKPVHLLCKNNDEFLYWIKAFVELNNVQRFGRRSSRRSLLINTPSESTLSLRSVHTLGNQSRAAVGQEYWNDPVCSSAPSQRHMPLDWSPSTHSLRDHRGLYRDGDMSLDHPATNGRRSSKGLNLDDIKFIDDEDTQEPIRTVRNRASNLNHSSNLQFTPEQASIPEDVSTETAVRPLSNKRLEAKRREIEKLKQKIKGDSIKRNAMAGIESKKDVDLHHNSVVDAKESIQELDVHNKQPMPPRKRNSHRDPSTLSPESKHQPNERAPSDNTSSAPFERHGFMRDKVRERKKNSVDRERTVSSPAVVSNQNCDRSCRSFSDPEDACKDKPSALAKLENRIYKANFASANFHGLERASSITHSHQRFTGRKQKSLRQKVLRKLGKQAVLSNSSPDINSTVENEGNYKNQEDSEIKLRRKEAFRIHRRPSSPAVLIRCQSEGSLLYDSSSGSEDDTHADDMRTLELSEETFLETYGVLPRRKKKGTDNSRHKRHTTYNLRSAFLDFPIQANENESRILRSNSHCRLSACESGSSSSSVGEASTSSSESADKIEEFQVKQPLGKSKSDGAKDAVVLRRPRSTGSEDGGGNPRNKESRNSWITSLTPHFGKKFNRESPTRGDANKITRKIVFNTPASNLTNASHKGYLYWRNKKKQFERLWCVLQDSCLYMYNSPQSASTEDAIVLRGYSVVANVKNLNRSRFPFRLERNGSPTIHLSADSDRDYMLWVGTLEKEMSMVLPASTDTEVLMSSIKNTIKHTSSDPQSGDSTEKSKTPDENSTREEFNQQKEHLLREVLAKTQKVMEEQRLLQEKHSDSPLPVTVSPHATKISKSQLNNKFTRAREEEEMRATKQLTLLNKRRNSAQLKLDQMAKQLAPKSGRRRRENPQQFGELEAKLRQMQAKLDEVDREIAAKQAMRLDAMEKIQQRLDLELLILEQRDTLDIIRKHGAWQGKYAAHQRGDDKLAAIDEACAASECSDASSTSVRSPDASVRSLDASVRSLDACDSRAVTPGSERCFGGKSPTDRRDVLLSSGCSDGGGFSPCSSSVSSSVDDLDKPRLNESGASNGEQTHAKDEVDPSILADIEDFQRFSRQKLASLANQRS